MENRFEWMGHGRFCRTDAEAWYMLKGLYGSKLWHRSGTNGASQNEHYSTILVLPIRKGCCKHQEVPLKKYRYMNSICTSNKLMVQSNKLKVQKLFQIIYAQQNIHHQSTKHPSSTSTIYLPLSHFLSTNPSFPHHHSPHSRPH